MKEIKVSVIIPVYNMEKYLLRCLRSVMKQTLKEIEIICVNDGSTDSSLAILQECANNDNRITIIDKKNTGYGNTMNIGIEQAKGDYIGIVESDDFIHPAMYENLYRTAIQQSAEVVKANYFIYSNAAKEETVYLEALQECMYHEVIEPMKDFKIFFVSPSIWSAIYSRQFINSNNIRFLNTKGASYQDTSFYFKTCFCAKRMYLLKEAYVYYWIDNENSSVNNPKKIFCVCDELNEIQNFLSLYNVEHQWEIALRYKFQVYIWNYNRLSLPYQYAFLLRMADEFRLDIEQGCFNHLYWNQTDKQTIEHIISDYDNFYHDTSKYNLQNMILNEIPLNTQLVEDRIEDVIKQFNMVIIYGAGKIGQELLQYLLKNIGIHADRIRFAVTDEKDQPQEIQGVSISKIDTLKKYATDGIVVVAVRETLQVELLLKVKRLGFKNYFRLHKDMLYKINTQSMPDADR